MAAIRRIQTPLALLVVVLLSSPALAACCVSAAAPMACCEKTHDVRLVTPCCMSSSQAPLQAPAPVVKLSKLEPGAPATAALQPSIAPAIVQAPSAIDRLNGPPGSDPLYLRLSAIRR
jgi:hypothetical protein